MITEIEVAQIEALETATSGVRWRFDGQRDGAPSVLIDMEDGSTHQLAVTREDVPASEDDVAYIAHSRDDVRALVAFLRHGEGLSIERLEEIARRCDRASPAPWRVFLGSDGGVGGDSVIWVSDADDQPDLYLWIGSGPAADADYEFVAAVRRAIPRLTAAARERVSR